VLVTHLPADAEVVAAAGDDQDVDVGIALGDDARLLDAVVHLDGERVAAIGAVDTDGEHAVLLLRAQILGVEVVVSAMGAATRANARPSTVEDVARSGLVPPACARVVAPSARLRSARFGEASLRLISAAGASRCGEQTAPPTLALRRTCGRGCSDIREQLRRVLPGGRD
jgi:hypothetical protein